MTYQKGGDGKFSIAKATMGNFRSLHDWWSKIFGHNKISDQNPFLVTNHNEGNPSMTQDFPTSILMNTTNASRQMLMW